MGTKQEQFDADQQQNREDVKRTPDLGGWFGWQATAQWQWCRNRVLECCRRPYTAQIKETTMKTMTLVLAAVAAATMFDARPSQAYEGPWCAYMLMGLDFYSRRCDLPNFLRH